MVAGTLAQDEGLVIEIMTPDLARTFLYRDSRGKAISNWLEASRNVPRQLERYPCDVSRCGLSGI